MHKILLIIKREYFSRVKKKSFLLMTFLVPLFFIALYGGIFYLTKKSFKDAHAHIYILDQEGSYAGQLKNDPNITFTVSDQTLDKLKVKIKDDEQNSSILVIPKNIYEKSAIELISADKSNITIQDAIAKQMEEIIRLKEYKNLGINSELLKSIQPKINVSAKELTDDGEEKNSNTGIAMGIGVGLAILVYLSLFLYGVQVMRGVIEEKSNRIIEVIISSVKPFQLMMGKIIGIGMVGLTQFLLWILLTGGLTVLASSLFMNDNDLKEVTTQQSIPSRMSNVNPSLHQDTGLGVIQNLQSVNFLEIAICFFLFFLAGYLLYSAIFAAVGSAVDSETEANQFTMPITMPLLLTYVLSFGVIINDPNGPIATWLSFIPFTSPIAMLVRIPFGVPTWQIVVSLFLLIITFLLVTWLAAKIYRVGILIYGKKANFKEIIKWMKY
ncbi:ABC transporter permease [Sphingobacterium sp. SRCM116780]|uniref:ABC transporter permease n=1 Tax=Sphingobacterium sp. SRCM116780 TaxID=2907623 RepID=UPI001F2D1C27|nr:ABC transporter permease [Sphingobacterium sp. SRCM116780]UIR57787.1 ABC transporter permease [Sphingobacterium sp. SRCM116780]